MTEWKNKMNYIQPQWLIPPMIVLYELLFHWEIYGCMDIYMVYVVLLSLPFSALVLLLSSTRSRKWNILFRCVTLFLVTIYYGVQIIYHQVFGNFLSLRSIINGAGQAMDFGSTIRDAFLEHRWAIGIAVILWLAYVILEIGKAKKRKSVPGDPETQRNAQRADWEKSTGKHTWKRRGIYAGIVLVLPIVITLFFLSQGNGAGSTYDVKLRFHRTEQSMYRLGLLQTLKKDLTENLCDVLGITEKQINAGYLWVEESFFTEASNLATGNANPGTEALNLGNANEDIEALKRDDQEETPYHTMDIDFDTLIANAENEDVKDVHTYFSQQEPTAENEYTGLFEGYNLIYITAESFSDVAIDKDRTPTLYKMQQEGFQFENFYTPSWYLSTIDGEYVNLLGQIPVEGDWSLQHSAENALPIALGNQLSDQGYTCNAYHNHDSYYYDRTITHPHLGYTFKAVGAGLTFESMYPESDLELMELTVDEYIGDTPFHTYYMTMSGHLPYTYDYNSMAVKNRDVVEGKWSENAACYLAANTELEYAVAYLVEKLEQAGQLDNTLFVIAPDHYPYGLQKGAYDELQGREIENDEFEIYRNTCLMWSPSMKDMNEIDFPVKVDKCCSNLDILPTLSNLMGLSYDSRLFAGRDMLSEDMGLVLFKDHSFLTDKVRYNATTGEAVWAAGETEDRVYLKGCMQLVQNRFYYSAKVLELDYYNLVR